MAFRISSRGSVATGFRPRSRRLLGVGESPPTVNVLWGSLNLAVGFVLLFAFVPKGSDVVLEWACVGLGAQVMASISPVISAACARGTSRALPGLDWALPADLAPIGLQDSAKKSRR
jgi:hypothetical protein